MTAQLGDEGIKSDSGPDTFRQVLETAGDVVYTIDSDGYLTYINRRVQSLLGYEPEEMVGQHFEKYIASTWCDHARSLYQQILREQTAEAVLQFPALKRDGNRVWVEQVIAPLYDDAGKIQGVTAVTRDITWRDLTEAELENRVNQLATLQRIDVELTHQLDIDYVLSMALDAATRLSMADAGGIDLIREGEIYTGKVIGGYPPDFAKTYPRPHSGIVGRVIQNHTPELVHDVTKDPDYHPHIAETRAQMVIPLISQDRLIGVLYLETRRPERFTQEVFDFIQLITTRIAAAVDNAQLYATTRQQLAELQDLYRQITTLEQLKTDMIRIAAHDLGNPLTSISGFIDMLLESEMSEWQKEYATLVKDSASRMKKIIRNILSLQRIEEIARGNLTENIDMKELVQQVFDTQTYPAGHKNQSFMLEAGEHPLVVKGDSAQLREAVTNLISNALKYTPEGGTIVVKLWEEHDTVYFNVVDNGYGIPEAQQERLFRPFFRAKSKETTQIEGTGLGLHLVKNIVERHGGRMHFTSEYGKGSTFGFELPLYIGD